MPPPRPLSLVWLPVSVFCLGLVGCHRPTARSGADTVSPVGGRPTVVAGIIAHVLPPPAADSGVLRGHMSARDGKPVRAILEIRDVGHGTLLGQANTDAQGGFYIYLPPGTYEVSARVAGDRHDVRRFIEIRAGQDQRVEFEPPRS